MSSRPEVERPYKRLSPLTPLVRSFILVVAVAVSTWDDVLRGDIGPIAWVLLALLVAGAVYGTATWARTKYWIEAGELRVDTGLVSRQSRRIRVDRLQGVDIVQPFVARVFGLAELKLDVAGGGAREGSLAFLRLDEARSLRQTLLTRRDALRAAGPDGSVGTVGTVGTVGGGPDGEPAGVGASAAHGTAQTAPEQVVARLDLVTLVLSLLLSLETIGFVLAALVIGVVFLAFGQVGGLAAVLPVLGGFALTQFRRLSAYYGFVVTTVGTVDQPGLQITRGLFERSTQTIWLARVQGAVLGEPLLWRPLGWARLDVSVAGYASGSGDDGKPSASTVLPVGPRALAVALSRTLLTASGSPDPDRVPLTAPPPRARWVEPVGRAFLGAGVGEHLVVGREGVLNRRTHVVPHARVQSVRLRQGPWQRRLGLADVYVDSPPGAVRLRARHRDAVEARGLLEQESDRSRSARDASSRVV